MKRLSSLAFLLAVAGTASMAVADGPRLFPGKSIHQVSLQPAPSVYDDAPPAPVGVPPAPGGAPMAVSAAPITLFPCVKVEDRHNIHPCAVPKIVSIVDPCYKPCGCCSVPKCVYVKICVPPCGCERIKCSKDGRKVKYDYGKYSVELTSKNGKIYVDYDD